MKTKELIKQLQKADPKGNLEVSVGNVDIYFVERSPAYYDGCQEVLKRDKNNPYYNIIGAKIKSTGDKIVINTYSIEEAIFDNPKLPVDYSEIKHYDKSYKISHDKMREFAKKVDKELRLKNFIGFVKARIPAIEEDKIVKAATEFYNKYLHIIKNEKQLPTYEVKKEGNTIIPCWNDREWTYWNDFIYVYYLEGEVIIRKTNGV